MIQELIRRVAAGAVLFFLAAVSSGARFQDQTQQQPPQGEQAQPAQDQTQQDQQPKKKKKGFFEGLKAVKGQGSQEQQLTATGGAKTVGEGAKIAEVTPTDADRQALAAMESYSIPEKEMKKFQQTGHLRPNL